MDDDGHADTHIMFPEENENISLPCENMNR